MPRHTRVASNEGPWPAPTYRTMALSAYDAIIKLSEEPMNTNIKCPACLAKGIDTQMLQNNTWIFCPVCGHEWHTTGCVL
jgi:hypothetical protein